VEAPQESSAGKDSEKERNNSTNAKMDTYSTRIH
jgi:hypothetical protein